MSRKECTSRGLALEEMKTVHKDLEIFKKPRNLPISKKRRQVVLDEDAYVEEIGKIIQRDFFPSLEKLKAQNDYIDAMERNDVMKLRELYAKYSGKKLTPLRVPSPATFETPVNLHNSQHIPNIDETITIASESSSKTSKLSLDQFLNSHTSEDNDSFVEILNDADKKHREKYDYLYNEEGKYEEEQKRLLALPSIEEQAMLPEKKFNVDTWGYKNRNYIMYVPDGVELTEEKLKEIDEKRLKINYSNTRLDVNPFDETQNKEAILDVAKAQAKILDGRIGVDGKELVKESPKIQGYSFIKDPSPCPDAMASPLMTWGVIEGTPFRLDGGDTPLPRTPGPSFKMAEPPRREQLALELAEKAVEKDRDKRKKAMEAAKRLASPSPRIYSSLDRIATMSPAARKLASSSFKLGVTTPLLSPALNRNTPIRRKTPKTPQRIVTPKVKAASSTVGNQENLTDDLLKIEVPKRLTAADFF
ncbi:hypothetical protein WA026_002541 [Henosepilachna vigintioctopunctata]|uniref:Uncharacterized protein n=1 Tax=Henosepilachna vigintioctopunctata TaxID=420089 RepID=A0AAW1TTS3_9CUCU